MILAWLLKKHSRPSESVPLLKSVQSLDTKHRAPISMVAWGEPRMIEHLVSTELLQGPEIRR